MTISVGTLSKVQGTYRVEVSFTSQAPVSVALVVDGELAWGGDAFTTRFRNSKVKKNPSSWAFALVDANDTMSLASVVSASASADKSLGFIPLPLHGFRECSAGGDVGAIAANGGILASDTTPTMTGDAAGAQCITWAAGNADPICCQVPLPPDFNGTLGVTVDFDLASGTTNAASLTIQTSWDGGALVSDANDDSASKSATAHRSTATVAAADVPDAAKYLTVILTPPTHATDAIALYNAAVRFTH